MISKNKCISLKTNFVMANSADPELCGISPGSSLFGKPFKGVPVYKGLILEQKSCDLGSCW